MSEEKLVMVEKTPDDGVRTGKVESEGGVESATERSVQWPVSEAGLALVYLLSFAAVCLCWGSGYAPVAAVGGVGLLVAMVVCLLTALRGQLMTSVVLMILILWLIVLKDPQTLVHVSEQLVYEGEFVDFTE